MRQCLLGLAVADDGSWAFEGAFVGFKDEQGTVAIFAMQDRSRIELPVAALSEASRLRLPKSARLDLQVEGVTTRGPFGHSVTLSVPAILKAVETDAIWCRTAAEAVRVYDLFLAGESLSEAERNAAEKQRAMWAERAKEGRVRLGDAWVTPAEFKSASDESRSLVLSALQSFRLEDAKRAEAELVKASRQNPEDGTAEFVLGLAYWLQEGPSARTVEHFGAAARRSPDDPYILNNLLVCDIEAGRYGNVVDRFTRVLNLAPSSQLVVDNLGLTVFGVTSRKAKMPERIIDRLVEMYRKACQDLKLSPIESTTGRKFAVLSPEGRACRAGPLSTLPLALEKPRDWLVRTRYGTAVNVAPKHFLVNRSLVANASELVVQIPGDAGGRFAATEIAWLDDCDVSLLRCESGGDQSLSVADRCGGTGEEMKVLVVEDGILSPLKPVVASGRIVAKPAGLASDNFFYSAVVPRGIGGGPIVDRNGRLIGVVASTPKTDQSGNTLGCGIPIDKIWPLLKEHLPDVQSTVAGADATASEDLYEQVALATGRIIAIERQTRAK